MISVEFQTPNDNRDGPRHGWDFNSPTERRTQIGWNLPDTIEYYKRRGWDTSTIKSQDWREYVIWLEDNLASRIWVNGQLVYSMLGAGFTPDQTGWFVDIKTMEVA